MPQALKFRRLRRPNPAAGNRFNPALAPSMAAPSSTELDTVAADPVMSMAMNTADICNAMKQRGAAMAEQLK